jgi:hypothetical protein
MAYNDQFNFDDNSQWVTVPDIPVLDEHTMRDPTSGKEVKVTAKELGEIASNNNRRVQETNNPAPLVVGHTSDEVGAPEPPVVGYAVNYRVAPFLDTGRQAIFVDYKIRRDKANVIKDFPRRSVELWWERKEFDPIALLGGTTPERDLGDLGAPGSTAGILKFSRSQNQQFARATAGKMIAIDYWRHGSNTVFRYEMPSEDTMATSCSNPGMAPKPRKMDKMDMGGDEKPKRPDGTDVADSGESDPEVQKVFASKQWSEMKDMVQQLGEGLSAIMEELQGGGAGGTTPPKGGKGKPMDESMEAQTGHPPVRFAAEEDDDDMDGPDSHDEEKDTDSVYKKSMGGVPASGYVPDFVEKRRMGRQNPRAGAVPPQYFDPTLPIYPEDLRTPPPGRYGRQPQPQFDAYGNPIAPPVASDPTVIKLQRESEAAKRENLAMKQRLAAMEQEKEVEKCRQTVMRFAREHRINFQPADATLDQRTAEQVMEGEAQLLALMPPAGQKAHETRILTLYKRHAVDPVAGQQQVARFARIDGGVEVPDPVMPAEDVSRLVQQMEMARSQGQKLTFAEATAKLNQMHPSRNGTPTFG